MDRKAELTIKANQTRIDRNIAKINNLMKRIDELETRLDALENPKPKRTRKKSTTK